MAQASRQGAKWRGWGRPAIGAWAGVSPSLPLQRLLLRLTPPSQLSTQFISSPLVHYPVRVVAVALYSSPLPTPNLPSWSRFKGEYAAMGLP